MQHENEDLEQLHGRSFETFQRKLINTSLMITLMAFILEIALCPVCYLLGVITFPLKKYVILLIIVPTILNILIYLIGRYVYNHTKSHHLKVLIPITMIISLCWVICVFHGYFIVLYGIFLVPMILSTVYGNKTLTQQVCLIAAIAMTFAFMFITLDVFQIHFKLSSFNMVLAYGLIIIVYTMSVAVITYENQKEKTIQESFKYSRNLEHEVLYDNLTNLYNHRALFDILNDKISKNKSENLLQIAIVDIDFFKKVNDTYGHEMGNVVLCKLSSMLRDISQNNIYAARYGGEEFVVIFDGYTQEQAYKIIDIIKDKLGYTTFDKITQKITFSAGIATYEKGLNANKFIEKADEALYYAKEHGRNQIKVI